MLLLRDQEVRCRFSVEGPAVVSKVPVILLSLTRKILGYYLKIFTFSSQFLVHNNPSV